LHQVGTSSLLIYIPHLKTQKNKPVSNTLTQTSKYAIKGHYN